MTRYSFSGTFSLNWECLFSIVFWSEDARWIFLWQYFSDQFWSKCLILMERPCQEDHSSCSVYFDARSLTWTQWSLCVWGRNCGCWQKSFMLTGQIKHGATGEAEGNSRPSAGGIWPKTTREPNSVTAWIVELETLTFFLLTFLSGRWKIMIWICSVNESNWCVEAVWLKVLNCFVKHHHVNAGMCWVKFNIPPICKVYWPCQLNCSPLPRPLFLSFRTCLLSNLT